MRCVVCENEFEAKRVDARFCSASCRVKAGRMTATEMVVRDKGVVVSAPEKIKKTCSRTEKCCEKCVDFESGIHWCPNKECGCWQINEEQMKDVKEHQARCSHPQDIQLYSRCLDCGAMIPWVKGKSAYLSKEFCKKHDFTLKSSCGCK